MSSAPRISCPPRMSSTPCARPCDRPGRRPPSASCRRDRRPSLISPDSWRVLATAGSVGIVSSWRRTCAVLVALVSAACVRIAPETSVNAPPLLAVVTWNLHGGEGDLPRLLDDLTSGELTAAPVRDYVLLLQEAIESGKHDVRAIASARTLAVAFSAVRRTGRGVSGNAILSTRPLGEVRVVNLPRERQPRAALTATLDVAGQPLFIVDTHLENRLGWMRGLFGDRARGRQAEALLAAIPSPGHGILGGDMNTMLGVGESAL